MPADTAKTPRLLLILYGSETGTAQDLAESLWRDARRRRVPCKVMAFDDCNLEDLAKHSGGPSPPTNSLPVVVFVIATSGQGEMPANARGNWRRLLAKRLLADYLGGLPVAIMGLGDSSYAQHYNFAAKKLARRLEQLGARRIVEVGLADDQHPLGVDAAFEPWREKLWEALGEEQGFGGNWKGEIDSDETTPLPPKYVMDYGLGPSRDARENDAAVEKLGEHGESSEGSFYEVEVISNERVTRQDHFQDTRLITFSLPLLQGDGMPYKPGDVLMVQPRSLDESVELAVKALGLENQGLEQNQLLDKLFWLCTNYAALGGGGDDEDGASEDDASIQLPPKWLLPQPTSLRRCLHNLFDLQAIPRRSLLKQLAQLAAVSPPENNKSNGHSSDEEEEAEAMKMECDRLTELASAEHLDDYLDYCQRPRRTIAELLRDFPLTAGRIPPARLFDLLPTMRPRAFSIASSPTAHPGVVQLLVARVDYRAAAMKAGSLRLGLCSNFLARLATGDKVFVRIRPGTFRLDYVSNPSIDPRHLQLRNCSRLMLVGPGTGVAPFRSIIATNAASWFTKSKANDSISPREGIEVATHTTTLYFGCRYYDRDYYFAEEWVKYEDHLCVVTAFSREKASGLSSSTRPEQQQRTYVQHRILERSAEVWKEFLANQQAKILVAGSAGDMPKGVMAALVRIAEEVGGVKEPERFLTDLQRSGRIQFETWS